jgi:hypothetical protein
LPWFFCAFCLQTTIAITWIRFTMKREGKLKKNIRSTRNDDQRLTDLYYLTRRNYYLLMLSAFCGRVEDHTQDLSVCESNALPA